MTFSYKNSKIKISKSVLEQIYQLRQIDSLACESGGVLIGRQIISTGNLIIDHCTFPMPLDVCKRTRYFRKDPKHIEIFTTLRQRENNIYAYVGEWHTHPELIPLYSSMDLRNWERIGKESSMSHFHLIAGTKAFRIWQFDPTNKSACELKTILWDKIHEYECLTS